MLGTFLFAMPSAAIAGAGAAAAAQLLVPGTGATSRAARFGAACGLLAAPAILLLLPPAAWPAAALFALLLVALAWLDLAARVVHAALALPLALAGVLCAMPDAAAEAAAGALLGYGLMRLAEAAFRRLRGREGIGRGDAWMLGAIGAWVGAGGVGAVLALAALLALAGAALAARGLPRGEQALPFVPALALAGWIVWLGGAG